MANLIPKEAKKSIYLEYWTRVLIVWLTLISTGLLVVTLLFVPVYVLLDSQTKAYKVMYNEASLQTDQYTQLTKEIDLSNETAELLMTHKVGVNISEYLNEVSENTGKGIAINIFSYNIDPLQIRIGGVAKSRADLVTYKSILEESELFERIELPISSLASEKDIAFTMELVLTPPKI